MQDYKYPKIDAKHFHYHNDGTGRDQYVKHNNGGLLAQKMLVSLELSPKAEFTKMIFPKTSTKLASLYIRVLEAVCCYHHNINEYGKGRDYFVTINDGGQVSLKNWRDHPDEAFPAQLRKYTREYSSPDCVAYLMPNNSRLQVHTSSMKTRQKQFTQQISLPKKQSSPNLQTFMPDLAEGGKYQTYQQLKYQSKACSFAE